MPVGRKSNSDSRCLQQSKGLLEGAKQGSGRQASDPLPLGLFFFLFLSVLGLRFCARAFSSCSKWGPLFIAVRGPLTMAASLVAEHRLQTRRLSSCGSQA